MSIRRLSIGLISTVWIGMSGIPVLAEAPILFSPPPSDGSPGKTRGSGSRDNQHCPQDRFQPGPSFSALVPPNRAGITWSDRPTLWVYLPKTSARQMILILKEKDGPSQHSQKVPITGESGIVGISLAENAAPLSIDKTYQWAVVLMCKNRLTPNDPFVQSSITRKRSAPIQVSGLLEQAAEYSKQGVWHDALTTLAQARQAQPQDKTLQRIWQDFLKQPAVGLGAIAKEPLR
jgi:hypothetical protein